MVRRYLGLTISQLFLVGWTALTLIPFVLIALFSLRDNAGLYAYPLGIGGTYHPENYVQAWLGPGQQTGMATYFRNTGFAAGVGLVVNLVFGAPAAYFAVRLYHRARVAFLGVFIGGQVVPFVLILIPYFQVFNYLNILSNPGWMGVIYGILALPTTVLVLNSFFLDFPTELVEAGAVDGLGEVTSFTRIVLPLSKGAITAVGMLALVYFWGEAQLGVVLLQTSDSQTVTVGLLGFQGEFISSLGPLFAGLSIASLPVIVIYLVFNRFITKGIALGGVFR